MKKMTLIVILLLLGGFFVFRISQQRSVPDSGTERIISTESAKNVEIVSAEREPSVKNVPPSNDPVGRPKAASPQKVLVQVPFTSQAPFGKWDDRHEEACEEASLLMVAYYLQKKTLNRDIAERELQAMIDFQLKKYGEYKDSNAAGIVRLAKDYFKIDNLKVVYDFKQEDLLQELAKNNPVIIPAAGRRLGNPNFTAPGPLYHALVLVGYEGDEIITNDPGTRKGEGYRYDADVLFAAIHDFPGRKDDIELGRKAMVVID